MRDPKRIRPIIEKLALAWEQNPDMRLGQLINSLSDHIDVFYIEDDKLDDTIRQHLLTGKFGTLALLAELDEK